jgi:hypothetical protein
LAGDGQRRAFTPVLPVQRELLDIKNNYIRSISETFNAQFRLEMFNVLNHANFAPSGNLSPINADGTRDPSFGQITSTQGDNRIIQLALKLIW